MNSQQIQSKAPAQTSSRAEVEKQKTEREAAFRKIWSDTHKDYRGRLPDGTYTVMGWAKYGGGLVSASSISDAELAERLESIKRRTR